MSNEQDQQCNNPEILSKYIKYYSQSFLKNKRSTPFNLIRYKTEYKKNKNKYDKLFEICSKYKIDILDFIKHCIVIEGFRTIDSILNINAFNQYANFKKRQKQYVNIIKYYTKSANNIADMCIRDGFKSSYDCLSYLINNDMLAMEYYSGRISKYYLVTLDSFEKIFKKMSRQSRDELCIILGVSETLKDDVQKAFMEFKNIVVQPIGFTDKILKNKLEKLNKLQN